MIKSLGPGLILSNFKTLSGVEPPTFSDLGIVSSINGDSSLISVNVGMLCSGSLIWAAAFARWRSKLTDLREPTWSENSRSNSTPPKNNWTSLGSSFIPIRIRPKLRSGRISPYRMGL